MVEVESSDKIKKCAIKGCRDKVARLGLCSYHYAQYRAMSQLKMRQGLATQWCRIHGCFKTHTHESGLCTVHNKQLMRIIDVINEEAEEGD